MLAFVMYLTGNGLLHADTDSYLLNLPCYNNFVRLFQNSNLITEFHSIFMTLFSLHRNNIFLYMSFLVTDQRLASINQVTIFNRLKN